MRSVAECIESGIIGEPRLRNRCDMSFEDILNEYKSCREKALAIGGKKLAERKATGMQMNKSSMPYDRSSNYIAHDVIDPRDTREWLIPMLDVHRLRMSGGMGQHLMRTWPTSC